MTYDYDWCGHEGCGAPIERWSREWKHRKYELDADHQATPQGPVGPLEEGLFLRADRYAQTLTAAVAADARIEVLTELVRIHEYHRSQAESALSHVEEDPQFGRVWDPTGPEPDVDALLCLTTGQVYRRRPHSGRDWLRADLNPTTATGYAWPIEDAGPFIGWQDGYGFDRVLREARKLQTEFDALHRALYSEPGYRADDASVWGRPVLADAINRILLNRSEARYEANRKAQNAEQKLAQLRRSLAHLAPDDTQQWPADGDDVRDVEVIDLDKVRALLDRADCGAVTA
jgi:hypothetical protein